MNKLSFKLITLFVVCLSVSAFSQTDEELKVSALRDAKTTSKATLEMDFETVFKHTYPSIITIMGGKENGLKLLKDTFDGMKTQGFVFEKADIISVSDIVFEQDEHRCYVEGYNQMTMNNMRIKAKSYLLGIYNKEKELWYFIEAKQLANKPMMDQVLPDFKTGLEIPEGTMTTEQL